MAPKDASYADGVAGTLGKLIIPLGLALIVEGAIIAYVLPAIPGVIMTIAVIGWVFAVMELLVAAPLWAAAHAYAEGEGFAPQQAQYGYGAAIGIVMRPVLLTFGFIIMFFLIFIVGHFVGGAISIYLRGMAGKDLGVVGAIAVLAIILGTLWGSIKFLMGLITNLADQVPQWIGGRGQNLGEKENAIQSVQAGGEKAKTLAAGSFLAVKNAARDTRQEMRQNAADREAAAAKIRTDPTGNSETVRSTNADNLSGGEAKEKDKKE
ncbi:DotA/TraY family protein [Acidithiobacillus caldus]